MKRLAVRASLQVFFPDKKVSVAFIKAGLFLQSLLDNKPRSQEARFRG